MSYRTILVIFLILLLFASGCTSSKNAQSTPVPTTPVHTENPTSTISTPVQTTTVVTTIIPLKPATSKITPLPTTTTIKTSVTTIPSTTKTIQSTISSTSKPCECTSDSKNCSNFKKKTEAQACYDYCISQGAGDIHRLDADGDSEVCESLP